MRFPLVWRTTLEQERQRLVTVEAEHRALVERMLDQIGTLKADLAEAEARAVVAKPVKKESEQTIRQRLAERGLQGERLEQAAKEIVEQGMRTLGRLT